jgi:transposase-like protein
MNCEICGREMVKAGIHHKRSGHYQRFKCQHCGTIRLDTKDLGWTNIEELRMEGP